MTEGRINGLALCAGYGGIELGIKLLLGGHYRTACYVERDPVPAGVLRERIRDGMLCSAPIWDDLRTFDGRPWKGRIDLTSAGFPCQPFSTAARGRNVQQPLWPEVLRVVRECESPLVFLENVGGARDYLRRVVVPDLLGDGYSVVGPEVFAAADVGAPHPRRRLFLLAHADGKGKRRSAFDAKVALEPSPDGNPWELVPGRCRVADGAPRELAHPFRRAAGNGVLPLVAGFALALLARAAVCKPVTEAP